MLAVAVQRQRPRRRQRHDLHAGQRVVRVAVGEPEIPRLEDVGPILGQCHRLVRPGRRVRIPYRPRRIGRAGAALANRAPGCRSPPACSASSPALVRLVPKPEHGAIQWGTITGWSCSGCRHGAG